MEEDINGIDAERELQQQENDSVTNILIFVAETEATKKKGMEISHLIIACIADLASKYTEAKDLEQFAQSMLDVNL